MIRALFLGEMSKHQTGIRVDRVLFKQFQQLCALEKLRPGEAVESLMRVAVVARTVTGVSLENASQENTVRMFDDVLFRSKLSRLKTSLELEQKYRKETGGEIDEDYRDSDQFIEELTALGRRSISPELIREFEAILTDVDKQYEELQKSTITKEIERDR